MRDDSDLKAKLALVMGVTSEDLRLAIAIDLVRSSDEQRLSSVRARAGALGGQQKASNRASKILANPSKALANEPDQPSVSSENHSSRSAAQAVALPGGGLGVCVSSGLSDPDPQTGSSLSNPGDPQYHEPPPRRVKPITPPAYPAEFELAWAACDKVGTKADALKAWDQVGRPAADVLATSWAAWKRVAWVDGIGLQHVATWLRAFNWRETPVARPKTGAASPPPAAPANSYCPWHLDALRYRLPANKPLATCPACKHLAAASLKRTGEPQSLADIGDGRG